MNEIQLLVLPVLIPFAAAVATLFLKSKPLPRNIIALCSASAIIVCTCRLFGFIQQDGIQYYKFGGWIPPFGIVFTIDLFSAMMLLLGSFIATLALVYGYGYIVEDRLREIYVPLFFFLWAAINGAFSTGDIFNLFVFFEVMLMATYCLLCFVGENKQLEATMKLITLNLFGATFLLTAIAIVYSQLGTLNMADIARKAADNSGHAPILHAACMLFLVVFGMKAAMVPLHFWLPDAHSSAPTPISALLSGLLIKVGIYGIIRLFTLLFWDMQPDFQPLLLWLACITMIFGALGAVAQWDIKRLLAYSSISQVGYILMGIATFTAAGLSASLFYIINHAIIKGALFFIAGLMLTCKGSLNMKHHGGLIKQHPLTALLMLIAAFSLAGLPPFNGFFSKFMVIRSSFLSGYYLAGAVALAVSVITLFYIARAWQRICWGEINGVLKHRPPGAMLFPVIILCCFCVILGFGAERVIKTTDQIAKQLLDPGGKTGYICAVLDADEKTVAWAPTARHETSPKDHEKGDH